jgi:HD superfamily phosphohydrolase
MEPSKSGRTARRDTSIMTMTKIGQLYEKKGMLDEWKQEEPVIQKLLQLIQEDLNKRGFTLKDPRGIGSTGIILKVQDKNLKVLRAIKVPRPIKSKVGEIKRAIRGEVRTLISLNHENVVKVYYLGSVRVEKEPYPFFVMDYIRGSEDLSEFISKKEKLESISQFLKTVREVVCGLEYIHEQGFIHCDIKPENVLVARGSPAKIADLGYAHRESTTDKTLVPVRFTLSYAHPILRKMAENTGFSEAEAVRVELPVNKISKAFDLYALGMSIVELLHQIWAWDKERFTDYQRRYLSLIALRLLDGRYPEDELKDLPVDKFSDEIRTEIKYRRMSEVRDNFDKLIGNYSIERHISELNPNLWSTVQIPVSGRVPYTRNVKEMVEHPSFTRLTQINQLGLLNLLYPGATHSRFEHCLGTFTNTCHYLRALYYDEFNPMFQAIMSEKDVKCALLASLLHDIGQYPLCHDIEELRMAKVDKDRFKHETYSSRILRGDLELQLPQNVKPIKELIEGHWGIDDIEDVIKLIEPRMTATPLGLRESILRSLINSPIDADRLDYLQRDSVHIGVPYGKNIDFDRLLKCLTITYDSNKEQFNLGIYDKGRISAEVVAFARYAMFLSTYWHHTARIIKAMVLFIIFNTLHVEKNIEEFEGYIFNQLGSVKQPSLPNMGGGTIEDPVMSSGQAKEGEKQTLQWLANHGTPAAKDTVRLLLNRTLYKRLIEVPWSLNNEDLYKKLQRIQAGGMDAINSCRTKLEEKLVQELGYRGDSGGFWGRAPLILIDIPWRDWGMEDILFFSRSENKFKPLSELSPLWAKLHREFNESVAIPSVFARPDVKDAVENLGQSFLQSLEKQLQEVVNICA